MVRLHNFSALSLAHSVIDLPGERVEGIWRQVLDVFRGGLLADWCAFFVGIDYTLSKENFPSSSVADQFSLQVQEAEEKFDLALIATLEIDVIPHLGDSRVPDAIIVKLPTLFRVFRQTDHSDDTGPIVQDSPKRESIT